MPAPILTKPTLFTKGVATEITLSKGSLSLMPAIASNEFFQDSGNWRSVSFYYRNAHGQTKTLVFNTPLVVSTLVTRSTVRSSFQLQSITIIDFDGGKLTLVDGFEDLELDITFAPTLFLTGATNGDTAVVGLTDLSTLIGTKVTIPSAIELNKFGFILQRLAGTAFNGALKLRVKSEDGVSLIATSTTSFSPIDISTASNNSVYTEFEFANVAIPAGTYKFECYLDAATVTGSQIYFKGSISNTSAIAVPFKDAAEHPTLDLAFKLYTR